MISPSGRTTTLVFIANGADAVSSFVMRSKTSSAADDATFDEQLLCGCQRRIHVVLDVSDVDTAGKLPMA